MASIAETRSFFKTFILADISLSRAEEAIALLDDRSKFVAEQIDARDRTAISALIHKVKADVVVNACDPRMNEAIFGAAYDSHCNYIDMAMNLSAPHPTNPYEEVGEPLGKSQLDDDAKWRERNILALVGMGVEPGLSDVFARYAADNLFDTIDEIGVRAHPPDNKFAAAIANRDAFFGPCLPTAKHEPNVHQSGTCGDGKGYG